MSDVKLGQLIEGPKVRDAIHVAIAPVVATEKLMPGQHIGFAAEGNTEKVKACKPVKGKIGGQHRRVVPDGQEPAIGKPIGIVDPFLTEPVMPGQWFNMLLYQNTVTSLRHEWEHPDFVAAEKSDVAQAREWITEWAGGFGVTYDDMIEAAESWCRHEDYFSRGGTFEGERVPEEFWEHYEAVIGRKIESRHKQSFFSCSC